jgi:hypothetical protein
MLDLGRALQGIGASLLNEHVEVAGAAWSKNA